MKSLCNVGRWPEDFQTFNFLSVAQPKGLPNWIFPKGAAAVGMFEIERSEPFSVISAWMREPIADRLE